MDQKKEVLFDPFPKQEEFLEAVFSFDFRFILFGGAIRGGKTFAGLGALLMLCKMFPGSRWAIVRSDLPTLKRNTIPSFNKIVPQAFMVSHNQETQTVTFTNSSQIIFFPENFIKDPDLNRWKGLEVNGFLLEEINELREKSFYKAIERAGSHIMPEGKRQPPPLILGTCNPAKNWVKDKIHDPWKKGKLPDTWLYIQSRIYDNPYVPQDYKDSLKQLPKTEYAMFVDGDWDVNIKTGGEFYGDFIRDVHVVTNEVDSLGLPELYDYELPLHITFDENVHPYLTLLVWHIESHDGEHYAYQIDEFPMKPPHNTLKAACRAFAKKYNGHKNVVYYYGDATSKKEDVKLEKGYNFYKLVEEHLKKEFRLSRRIPSKNPPVAMRGNWINALFENSFSGITVEIGSNCKTTIKDYELTMEAADGTKQKKMIKDEKTGISYQEHGHCTDANDYLLCEAFKDSFILYQRGVVAQVRRIQQRSIIGGY